MRTSRAVALKGVSDIVARGIALVTFPLIVRNAGADGFGAYSQLLDISAFVVPFVSAGVGSAIVRIYAPARWTAKTRRHVLRASAFIVGMSAIWAVLLATLARPLNVAILGWPDGADLFRAGAALLVITSLELAFLELLRAREQLAHYAWFQLMPPALTAIAAALVLPASGDVVDFVLLTALLRASAVAAGFLALIVAVPATDSRPDAKLPSVFSMPRIGLPLAVTGIGLSILHLGDRLVIGRYLSPGDLGLYSATYAVALLATAPAGPFLLPALPRMVNAWSRAGSDGVEHEVRVFHRYVGVVTILAAGLLCAVSSPAIAVLSDGAIQPGLVIVVPIVVGIALNQWNGLAHYVLIAQGRTVTLQNLWLTAAVGNMVVNAVAVPVHGLKAAAILTLIGFAGLETAVCVRVRRSFRLRQSYAILPSLGSILAAVAGIGGAVIVLALVRGGAGEVVYASTAYVAIAALVLLVVRVVRPSELRDLFRSPTGVVAS
jgi:O-antigen/teichoic acid export membrane protein